ncbi:KR domain-containing protein [Actinoplanes sp. NPDC004185]
MPPTPHVPQSAAPVSAAPAQSADPPGWETLELARHSAEAHATFQRLMTEAHLEYLRVIEALTGRPAEPDRAGRPADLDRSGRPADLDRSGRPAEADRPTRAPAAASNTAAGRWATPAASPNRRAWPASGINRRTDPVTGAEHRTGTPPQAAGTDHRARPVQPGPGAEHRTGMPAEPPGPATSPTAVPVQPDRQGTATDAATTGPDLDEAAPDTPEATRTAPEDRTTATVPAETEATDPDPADTGFIEPTFPGLAGFDFGAAPTGPATLTRTEPADFDPAGPAHAQAGPTGFTQAGPALLTQAGPQDIDVVRLTMSWAQTPLGGLAPPGLHAGPVHVVDGGSGLATAVAAELTARGLAAEVATHPGLGGVIFLGGMARPASPEAALEAQLTALWLARNGKDRGIFVTVADTVSGRAGAWLGGLVGLVGAVGRDRPAASAIAIECERGDREPADVAVLIADELTRGAGAQRVRVAADGTRSVGRLVSAGAGTPRERVIGPDSVIVASGEARGFCGAALVELARAAQCRLVLLGRTPLAAEPEHLAGAADEVSLMRKFAAGTGGPDGLAGMRLRARAVLAAREIRETIAACVAAGAEARYVHADDRDADRLTAELDLVRSEWGPITGVLHCAEVVVDRRPGEKSAADADRALSTHLAGLPALLAATTQDPLDTLMLFSSVAGWSGDLGQGTQALIGATLDRIAEAEQRRRPGCLVRSLAWDPAGPVTGDADRGDADRAGAETVPVHARAAAFVAELAVDGPAHIVLTPRSTVPDRAQPASVAVDAGTHPWLADHRPQDVAILPLAAGLGWMAAAARVREQDAVLTGVRVLRSVATEHPQTIGVTVFGREVWLSNDAGEPCFRAGFGAPGPDREWRPAGDPARFPGSSVYAGRPLFHGPRLHVVRSLGEIGPQGVVGTVLGARAMGWPDDDLPVDLAALDGALQLSGVWAMDEHRPVLPMGVAECRIHRWGRLPGPALCIVADGHRDERGARCDAALVGPDGELWAELLGIEFIAPAGPLSVR